MAQHRFIKGITLIGFVFLITSFLLYRAGKFDSYFSKEVTTLQTSPNGGTINSSKSDSIKTNKDSVNNLMLSSSKVIILTDKKHSFFLDSIRKKDQKKDPFSTNNKTEIMGGSKSAIIFKPNQFQQKKNYPDTLKQDSIKIKKTP